MEQKKFDAANTLQTRIKRLKGIKNKLSGGPGGIGEQIMSFSVTVHPKNEPPGTYPSLIPIEEEFLHQQMSILLSGYCDEKIIELQKEFEAL